MKGLRQAKASPVVVFTQLCESGFIALQNVRRWFPIQPQTAAAQTLSRMGFRHFKVFMASPKHRKIKFVEHFSFNMLWQQNSEKIAYVSGEKLEPRGSSWAGTHELYFR